MDTQTATPSKDNGSPKAEAPTHEVDAKEEARIEEFDATTRQRYGDGERLALSELHEEERVVAWGYSDRRKVIRKALKENDREAIRRNCKAALSLV